ncbi:TPA: translation initiation factor IF-2 [Candidatus Uhrbacteria bacterium]|nr:translation initiation factor IF-2 [Candidatus Uhrbacteria bacterium]
MNISELARRLRVPTEELRSKLPELGFDIGNKAIKIPDRDAGRIMNAWQEMKKRQYLQKKMEDQKARLERKEKVKSGDAEKILIPATISVRDFATALNLPIAKVMQELMRSGILASLNERIDFDSASIIAEDLGFIAEKVDEKADTSTTDVQVDRLADVMHGESAETLVARAPVIVVMGHVDHGKTLLLDTIRKTRVIDTEAGGITQHIGAYQVVKDGRALTFIDTPGHEAFTVMRSRGAKVADIAILVVAADDGIQPQTREVIDIIKASQLPFIVAINKIDKPEANIERIYGQLGEVGLVPEEWGGKTICVPVSAKAGLNIDKLLDMLLLVADLEKAKIMANPDRPAIGTVIESHVDKGQGPVATVLVQTGTLHVGDVIGLRGSLYGKVRAMKTFDGKDIKVAPPSTPVKILGFKEAPSVGDILEVPVDAALLGKLRLQPTRKSGVGELTLKHSHSIEEEGESAEGQSKVKFNVVVKADVLGSLEALMGMLEKIDNPYVGVEIVGKGLGNVTDADVMSADAAHAVIFGFNVKAPAQIMELARSKNVIVEEYQVIYRLFESVVNHLKKLLPDEKIYSELGSAEVLALFKKTDKGQIVGCRVKKGKLMSGATVRVLRNGQMIGEGKSDALQSGKSTVSDVLAGQECGLSFVGKTKIEVGDILELYKEELQARTLAVEGSR